MAVQVNLNRSLAQIRKEIKDALLEIVRDAVSRGEIMKFEKLIYSDRIRAGNLEFPCLWIVPASHTPEVVGMNAEQHDFRFFFVTLVKDSDIDAGKETAEDLAARVYDLIMKDRELKKTVHDTIPGVFDPAHQDAGGKNIFWASVEMIFRVRRRAK